MAFYMLEVKIISREKAVVPPGRPRIASVSAFEMSGLERYTTTLPATT
jgi:hypothetical protein